MSLKKKFNITLFLLFALISLGGNNSKAGFDLWGAFKIILGGGTGGPSGPPDGSTYGRSSSGSSPSDSRDGGLGRSNSKPLPGTIVTGNPMQSIIENHGYLEKNILYLNKYNELIDQMQFDSAELVMNNFLITFQNTYSRELEDANNWYNRSFKPGRYWSDKIKKDYEKKFSELIVERNSFSEQIQQAYVRGKIKKMQKVNTDACERTRSLDSALGAQKKDIVAIAQVYPDYSRTYLA